MPPKTPDSLALAAQRIAALEAELKAQQDANAKLKKASTGPLTIKTGQAGGVSVYGLGRFPVTLYREQWERLLAPAQVTAILGYIEVNKSTLKAKGDPKVVPAAAATSAL